jgi:hypothetical protein
VRVLLSSVHRARFATPCSSHPQLLHSQQARETQCTHCKRARFPLPMAAAAAARLHLQPHLCRTPRAATLHRARVRTATSASAPLAITAAPANARASGRVLLLVRVCWSLPHPRRASHVARPRGADRATAAVHQGEGDFSFAHALMRSSNELALTASRCVRMGVRMRVEAAWPSSAFPRGQWRARCWVVYPSRSSSQVERFTLHPGPVCRWYQGRERASNPNVRVAVGGREASTRPRKRWTTGARRRTCTRSSPSPR